MIRPSNTWQISKYCKYKHFMLEMNDRLFGRILSGEVWWILQESELQLVDNSAEQHFPVPARAAAAQTGPEQLCLQVDYNSFVYLHLHSAPEGHKILSQWIVAILLFYFPLTFHDDLFQLQHSVVGEIFKKESPARSGHYLPAASRVSFITENRVLINYYSFHLALSASSQQSEFHNRKQSPHKLLFISSGTICQRQQSTE